MAARAAGKSVSSGRSSKGPVRIAWQGLAGQCQIFVVNSRIRRGDARHAYYEEVVAELPNGSDTLYFPVVVRPDGFGAELGRVARLLLAAGYRPTARVTKVDVLMCPIRRAPRVRLPQFEALRSGTDPVIADVVGA